jgi:hypothetical protein
MSAIALGLAGIIIGVAGSEFLRATKPEFVKKIEESAKRFVEDRILPGSDDDEPADQG